MISNNGWPRVDWPDKPRHRAEPVCDRCGRAPQPGSALCVSCADDAWWADKEAAEEAGDASPS